MCIRDRPGTIITAQSGGGGGFGEAFERAPELVQQDVIDGYVSREHAQKAYGVIINEQLEVDLDKTLGCRNGVMQ